PRASALLLGGIARLVGELDAEAVGELLDGLAEVESLFLLEKPEHVTAGLAAEAVVEVRRRIERERRRALVVERAETDPARAALAQLRIAARDLDDVCRRAHALDRVRR